MFDTLAKWFVGQDRELGNPGTEPAPDPVEPDRKLLQNTATTKNPDLLFLRSISNVASSGLNVTEAHALGVSAVFACVSRIAESIATAPVELKEDDGNGGRRPVTRDADIALAGVVKHKPNEEMNSLEYRGAATAGLALYRNSVTQIRRNQLGGVVELVPAHPNDVQVERSTVKNAFTPMGRKPLKYRLTGLPDLLDRKDVIHLKGLSFDGLEGIPLSTVARESIGLAMALDKNASAFFGNSSRPGMIMEIPDELDDESYARLQQSIDSVHQGVDNYGKTFLAEGGAKFKQITTDNQASQFVESRDRAALDIARFFGVPPNKIGILNAEPRGNVEENNIDFVLNTVSTYCETWVQGLNFSLLSDEQRNRGLSFEFDLRPLLAGNLKDKAQAYSFGGNLSVLTVDEFRKAVYGMNPLPDGKGQAMIIPPTVKREDVKEADEG